ncbi:SRPBCC family protein [Kitasatospora aureofaciens]|uniref:Polyketide cyclase n=1 Tax=Kitasatospora aureofaciens TaxID=1894 RepID=A0A1E7MWF4_KITAU|nr:SRPBCC family protein [Kitasatospora aureofaciens]QEU99400.1 SRPBCC family protein [Streptomyces viridifaciens]ARF78182.1 polyketide cyclase [Kitasatospora aureofaciens]OEV32772.1 polyketide cyclase [Kitasatospora aureofaciens]UKZ05474.1 SRPBCC family protein [Streptomyces viridifaciens]GGU81185.1 polyketide cyclase [Kitasatospora aureofaciens]
MGQVQATTERVYDAAPERVYEALADYQVTRPKLLPAQYSEYEVRVGGTGAGTQVHWKLQATEKRVRDCLFTVSAPKPDQLVEKDANSSMVITWTVAAAGEGRSKVTVTATWQGATGIGGFFERTFAPKGLNRIHDQVLANLAAEVR